MLRPILFAIAAFAIAAPTPAQPAPASEPAGNWIFSSVGPGGESAQYILKFESKGGKPSATAVFSPEGIETIVTGVQSTAKEITVTVKQVRTGRDAKTKKEVKSTSEHVFIGVRGKDPRVILGSTGNERIRNRAKLAATDKETLGKDEMVTRTPMPEPMTRVQALTAKVTKAQTQILREKDAETKKKLLEDYNQLSREATEQMSTFYREVVENHPDSPAALDAAMALLRRAVVFKLSVEETVKCVKVVQKHAMPYGPLFAGVSLAPVAETLAARKGLEAVALSAIEPAARAITDEHPAAMQARILSAYQTVLEKAGRPAESKAIAARLAGLEAKIDVEYLKSVPPFKPTAFAGRKDASNNRVVMMELFTGAQCPPCVAADVAFDALLKSYKPTDLVLVQYHMHIPGSDPMTNPDTIARWDYYRKLFPENIRGVPSSLFNGKPAGGAGGGMTAAEGKFQQYTATINPLLEESSAVKLAGQASRSGDKLAINVEVAGATSDIGDEMKLRLLVVEETVKYAGSNGIRFHHQVVRAMPGGPDGVAVKNGSFKHSASVDLGEVRKGLMKYLDGYVAKNPNRPFARPDRPMAMKDVHVIALVQNDKTGEIVQALQIDVRGATAGGSGQ